MTLLAPELTPTDLAWRASPAGYGHHFDPANYLRVKHVDLIAAAFRDACIKSANGIGTRTIVSLPPRHSKSETVTHWGPVWALDLWPHWKFMVATYAAEFAAEWGFKVRESIIEHAAELQVEIATGMSARDRWYTTQGGGMFTAGVGGPFTGRGANGFIIDDPFKNHEDASSETVRNAVWNWYQSTAYTRLEPNGFMFVVMCLAGETPVLLADGSYRPIRLIRPGDMVASYENGRITSARVLRWANQGSDSLLRVKMRSGAEVRANARHPFLTIEAGVETWRRTDELRPGDKILSVGARTGTSPAQLMGAKSGPNARACACRTTTKPDGPMGYDLLPSTPGRGERHDFATVTASATPNTKSLWLPSWVSAQSAGSDPATRTRGRIGTGSSVSTMTTTADECAACSATTATLLSDTARRPQCSERLLSTSTLTEDEVVAVLVDGIEDVFDIQVERTENFIANGLVTHNTRWHEDDIVGRLLNAADEGADEWRVIRLPALAEVDDPLGRREGQPLWPERFSLERLLEAKKVVGSYKWAGMYQQRPAPPEGSLLKRTWWQWYSAAPSTHRFDEIVLSWDMTYKDTKSSDYVVGQVWGRIGADKYLLDQVRGQMDFPTTMKAFELQAAKWPEARSKLVEDAANGPAVIAALRRKLEGIIAIPARGSKEARAAAVSPDIEAGNVFLPDPTLAPWIGDFVEECATFPNATHDDQVDAMSQALNRLGAASRAPETYEDERLYGRR